MLVAVHLSDVLTWPAAGVGWAAAALLVWWAGRGMTERDVSRVGVVTAAFFVGSQIHLPVGGVGSAHLLLNGVAGCVLGRRAPVAIAVGLVLQALLFGHGGSLALGTNITCYALTALLACPLLRAASRSTALRVRAVRAALTAAAVGLLVAVGVAAAEWLTLSLRAGELTALPADPRLWWLARPDAAAGVALAAAASGVSACLRPPAPAFAAGCLAGGAVALATVCLTAAALALGGEPSVRGAAPVVVLANLPLVAVEALAVGTVAAYLARARPEWVHSPVGRDTTNGEPP